MQIAFCIFKFFPHGGISRDLMKLARECLARGHRVRVYAARWQAEVPPDLEVVDVSVRALGNHTRYRRFADWVREHTRRHPVDLLVGMNKMPGLDVYYAGDSCYEEKARTQRGVLYRLLPRYRHFARFERAVFDPGVATEILTISDVQVPYFRKHYGTPPERFHPLPPGIDPDRRAPPDKTAVRQAFRMEHSIAEDEQVLLFLGSGFIKKGLDRVLLAFHALPETVYRRTRLLVVGHDNAEPFRRMARRLGVHARVRFFEGRDDVPRFLFGCDGLVLPAYDENAGMVILEAMIAGLPALVSNNCGYAHYLREAGAGLVTEAPFEQQRFNHQLLELLTSPERARWQANGAALADNPDIYRLAPAAVDYLETFAARRRRLLAFELFKYFPYGGLQRDFLRVVRACRARGHRVRVYTLAWQGEVPEGVDLVEVPADAWTNVTRYRRFARWVADDLEWRPAECVVGFNKLPGLDRLLCRRSLLPREMAEGKELADPAGGPQPGVSGLRSGGIRPRQPHPHPDDLAAAATGLQPPLPHPARAVHLLPPGISRDRMAPPDAAAQRAEFRREFGLGDRDLLLLSVGSGFRTKGLDRSLKAMAVLPEELLRRTRLFVIGQDNPAPFLQLARRLGLAERMRIFPGRDDVPRFLLGADLLLHPAYYENWRHRAAGRPWSPGCRCSPPPAAVTRSTSSAHRRDE